MPRAGQRRGGSGGVGGLPNLLIGLTSTPNFGCQVASPMVHRVTAPAGFNWTPAHHGGLLTRLRGEGGTRLCHFSFSADTLLIWKIYLWLEAK